MTNILLHKALADVSELAHKQNWTYVIQLADAIMSNATTSRLLVIAPASIDIAGFALWLREHTAQEIVTLSLEQLVQRPDTSATADKVVVVFECGQLIEADETEIISQTFLTRPRGSYAIVFGHAERINSEKDLDLIKRGMLRLFLPGTVSIEAKDLPVHALYLWTNAIVAQPELQTLLMQHAEVLMNWLRTPVDTHLQEDLTQYRVLTAITAAENEIAQQQTSKSSTQPEQSRRIHNTLQNLDDLKLRLLQRLDMTIEGTERTTLTSLQTLQADLLDGLHPYLLTIPQVTEMTEQAFCNLLASYISRGASRWQEHVDQLLASSQRDTIHDIEDFVQGIDWALVNQLTLTQGMAQTYPTALIERLQGKTPDPAPTITISSNQPEIPFSIQSKRHSSILTPLLHTAVGSSIISVIVYVLRFVGLNLSGDHLEDYEQYGQEVIQLVMRKARQHFLDQVQEYRLALKQLITTEVSILEQLLNQALQESRRAASEQVPLSTELALLQMYQQQLTINDNSL
jgi:hypothetical protein